jgi:hypothetical protein
MARGNWRNWDGRNGAESYIGMKVATRPSACQWCGHEWETRVPEDPVCPKCKMTNSLIMWLKEHPEEEKYISHKTKAMKKK